MTLHKYIKLWSFSSRKTNTTSITFQEISAICNSLPALLLLLIHFATTSVVKKKKKNPQSLIVIIFKPAETANDFLLLASLMVPTLKNEYSLLPFPSSFTCKHSFNISKASGYILSVWVFARQMHLSAWSFDLRFWWCLLRTLGINFGLWISTTFKILVVVFLWLAKNSS